MSKKLSGRIESIEYVHDADGLPYRHDFTRGDSDIRLEKDGSIKIHNRSGKRLWDVFTMKSGKPQAFLVNPSGKKPTTGARTMAAKRKRRSIKRRNVSAAARKPAPRRRRRRANGYGLAANPPKHRRRRAHRRNPPFNVNGIMRTATQGLMDAAFVVAGKTAARFVSYKLPYEDGSMMDSAAEVGVALAIGLVAPRFLGADRTRMLVAGAMSAPIEVMIAQAQIAGVSHLLGKVGRVGANTSIVYSAADSPTRIGRGVSGYGGALSPLQSPTMARVNRVQGYSTQPPSQIPTLQS